MALEIEFTCPLGSDCEKVKDEKIHRCIWYTNVVGLDANTGEQIDEWSCAMAWLPKLQVEMSSTNRGQTAALESFRNETVKGQAEFNQLVSQRQLLNGEKNE